MTWTDGGDLACNTCGTVLSYPTTTVSLEQIARAKGWHCGSGVTMTGKDYDIALCSDCVGSPRAKLPKVTPLEPQEPLF